MGSTLWLRTMPYKTGGGLTAMRRLGDFASCVMMWWDGDKSVMAEAAKLV